MSLVRLMRIFSTFLLPASLFFIGSMLLAQSVSQVSTLICGSNVEDWAISDSVTPSTCIEVTVVCGPSRGRNVPDALIAGNFRSHQSVIADLTTRLRLEEDANKAQIQSAITRLQRRDKRETEICQIEPAPKATPAPAPLITPNIIVPSLVVQPTATPTLTGIVTTASTKTATPTETVTGTPTSTPTSTPTNTPTNTPTSTPTSTPTDTPTPIPYAPYVSGDGDYQQRTIILGGLLWPTPTP